MSIFTRNDATLVGCCMAFRSFEEVANKASVARKVHVKSLATTGTSACDWELPVPHHDRSLSLKLSWDCELEIEREPK